MTKAEKKLLREFLNRMECNVGQHASGLEGDSDLVKDCRADDTREWELFNKLQAIVESK
jgi:hypothetical protein